MTAPLVEQCGAGLLAFIMLNMFGNQMERQGDYKILTKDQVNGFRQTGILKYPGQLFEPRDWTLMSKELLYRFTIHENANW